MKKRTLRFAIGTDRKTYYPIRCWKREVEKERIKIIKWSIGHAMGFRYQSLFHAVREYMRNDQPGTSLHLKLC